jgi:hypothetical protein
MPLLFIDYTNLVVKAYEEKRDANQLSQLLMHPTNANIRQECLNVYTERIKRGEEEVNTLRAFFGVPPVGKNFSYVIERYNADKFRPLQNLIKREIKNPAVITVELLAWLIDFTPRPLGNAQRKLSNTNETTGAVSLIPGSESHAEEDRIETNVVEIKEVLPYKNATSVEDLSQSVGDKISTIRNEDASKLSQKNLKKSSQKTSLKIPVFIILITSILFGGIYFVQQHERSGNTAFGNATNGCMYWANDHYEKVPCNEQPKGRLILPLNEEKWKNFKKITREDTITEWSIGKVYYIKDSNTIKCYTEGGSYPEDVNRNLRPLSRYIFDKYLRKKEIPGKDSLTE